MVTGYPAGVLTDRADALVARWRREGRGIMTSARCAGVTAPSRGRARRAERGGCGRPLLLRHVRRGSLPRQGQQGARTQGDRIGMLLDLDQGSMTVYKDGEKLGVMQPEGLLCWAVSIAGHYDSARIESTP